MLLCCVLMLLCCDQMLLPAVAEKFLLPSYYLMTIAMRLNDNCDAIT